MIWDLGWFKAPQTLSCRALTIDQDMLLPNHKVAEIVKIGVDNAKLQPIITYSLDLPLRGCGNYRDVEVWVMIGLAIACPDVLSRLDMRGSEEP